MRIGIVLADGCDRGKEASPAKSAVIDCSVGLAAFCYDIILPSRVKSLEEMNLRAMRCKVRI